MNIEQLVKRQEALIADMSKSLTARGFDAAILARPIEMQERRAASIEGRIAALEGAKRDQAEAIEAEIGALKAELKTLNQTMKKDRELLAPALKEKKSAVASKPKAPSRTKKG